MTHRWSALPTASAAMAFLKTSEDQGDSDYQRMKGRFQAAAMKASEAASFIRPELMAIPVDRINVLLAAPELSAWRLELDRTLRYRPHTLGEREEPIACHAGADVAVGKRYLPAIDRR